MNPFLKRILTVIPLLLIASNNSYCQNKKEDEISIQLTKCIEKDETTAGMCNCTYVALEQWDAKLNEVYKKLNSKLNPIAKSKLIAAQRAWILFKEKEIELINATYGKAEGTMWLVIKAEKLLSLTQDRTRELESLLSAIEEFN